MDKLYAGPNGYYVANDENGTHYQPDGGGNGWDEDYKAALWVSLSSEGQEDAARRFRPPSAKAIARAERECAEADEE